jgi:hypothetical protein
MKVVERQRRDINDIQEMKREQFVQTCKVRMSWKKDTIEVNTKIECR